MSFKDGTEDFLGSVVIAIDDGLRSATLKGAEMAYLSMPTRKIGERNGKDIFSPSPRGRPPGVRTGVLRGSLNNQRIRPGTWAYGTNKVYGRILEKGLNRPFLRPVLIRDRQVLAQSFYDAFEASMAISGRTKI